MTAALQRKRDGFGKFSHELETKFTDTTNQHNQQLNMRDGARIFRIEKCSRAQMKRSQQQTLDVTIAKASIVSKQTNERVV